MTDKTPPIATDPRCTECGEPVRCPRGHAGGVMDVGEPSAFVVKGKTAAEWACMALADFYGDIKKASGMNQRWPAAVDMAQIFAAAIAQARAEALEEAAELCDLVGSHRFKKVAHTGIAMAVAIRALATKEPGDGKG